MGDVELKLTAGQLIDADTALGVIQQHAIPSGMAAKVGVLIRRLRPWFETVQESQLSILKKYGKVSLRGTFSITQAPSEITNPQDRQAFVENKADALEGELRTFRKEMFTISIEPLPRSVINTLGNVAPIHLNNLEPLLELEKSKAATKEA